MTLLLHEEPAVSRLLTAGLLLAAISELERLGLPHPTAAAVLEATGASKTRAYELRAAVEAALPTLLRPPGRPPAPLPPVLQTGPDASAVMREAFDFLIAHPGAVIATASRQHYGDSYRHLALDLVVRHADLGLTAVADGMRVPLPTLQDWLAAPKTDPTVPEAAAVPDSDPTGPRIESILDAWRRWHGKFAPFCTFVRGELGIPYGDTLIGRILAVHAGRRPRRRPGRSPDEKATRGAFVAFFAGGQWVADGSPIKITLNGTAFTFNWELDVDAATGALVGASVRPPSVSMKIYVELNINFH